MMEKKTIKVGIWSDDVYPQSYRYTDKIKEVLFDAATRYRVVLVFAQEDAMSDELFGIAKLLNIQYTLWLCKKPKHYAEHLRDIDYNIFNKVLLEAESYKIVPAVEESNIISSQLDILILLKKGRIYMANL